MIFDVEMDKADSPRKFRFKLDAFSKTIYDNEIGVDVQNK